MKFGRTSSVHHGAGVIDGKSVEADHDVDGDIRQRGSRMRQCMQVLAAAMIYWVVYGDLIASGIIYASLLLPPCSGGAYENTTYSAGGVSNPSNGAISLILNTTPSSTVMTSTSSYGWTMTKAQLNSTDEGSFGCGGLGQSATRTAWATSLPGAVRVAFSFTGSVFMETFGVRVTTVGATIAYCLGLLLSSFATHLWQIYLARGVVSALGAGILNAVPIHCLALTFSQTRMTIANGIMFSGAGFASIAYGYLGKEVIAAGNWPWFYRLQIAFTLMCIPAAFLIDVQSVQASTSKDDCQKKSILGQLQMGFRELYLSLSKSRVLYRDTSFLLLAASYFFYSLGSQIPVFASSHRLLVLGINNGDAYLQAAYLGYGTIIGSVAYAVLGVLINMKGLSSQGCSLFLMGATTLCSILVTTETGLNAYNIAFAAVGGFAGAGIGPAVRAIVTAEMTGHAFGHIFLFCAIPMGIGFPISGWLFDATQSYTLPLVFGGVTLVLGGMIMFLIEYRLWKQERQERNFDLKLSNTENYDPAMVVMYCTSI